MIFRKADRKFEEAPGKPDGFRILNDMSIAGKGKNLNFDLRQLNPGQYSTLYHFHRNAEELFMIISGSATLRAPDGLQTLSAGDIMFFEMGEGGAHQLYNHTGEPCVFLDVRTFNGLDVCEYPDSNKLFIAPSYEIFEKDSQVEYFKGEENIDEIWKNLKQNDNDQGDI